MPASAQKKSWRRDLKARRAALGADARAAADAGIAQALMETELWSQADSVFAYVSFGDEVDTKSLIEATWRQGKQVVLPRMSETPHEMDWYVVESFDQLERNPYGIEEPRPESSTPVDVMALQTEPRSADAAAQAKDCRMLTLVPALAFDRKGNRLGYGGGYYDTFLRDFPGVSVGLCREAFLYDELPFAEAHDERVDCIQTESDLVFA